MSIFRVESYKKGILYSSVLSVFSKILGFGNNLILAYFFGTQAKMDVYFYTIATFTLLASLLTTMDSSVLIAQSMRIRERKSNEEAMKFLNFFLYWFLLVVILATLVIAVNPISFLQHFSKFQATILNDNYYIILLSLPLFFFMVVTTYLTDILYSYKFFTLPVIAGIINTCVIILFVVFFQSRLDILSVVLGAIFSYLINLALLVFLLLKKLRWDFRPKRVKIDKEVWRNLFYAQAGNIFTIFASYIPLYLLSNFNSGIISGLNYGKKIADLPIIFVTSQLVMVVNIKFNDLFAKGEFDALNTIFLRVSKGLIFVLLFVSGIFFLLSTNIINVLYSRGSFDIYSAKISADFLRWFVLGVPFLAIISIAGGLYVAAQIIKHAFWYQIIANSLQIFFIFFGIKFFGYLGYPIALLFISIINVIFVIFFVKRFFPYIKYGQVLIYLLKMLIINLIVITIIFKFLHYFEFIDIVNIIIGVLLYIALLFLIHQFVSLSEEINPFLFRLKSSILKRIR